MLWIWEMSAWTEPQSVVSQAWLALQAHILLSPILFLAFYLKRKR